jgi:hypothetical protein
MVYRGLVRSRVEDPLLPRLKGIVRKTWVANTLLLTRTKATHEALADVGIRGVFIEGVAVASRFYPELGLRPSAIDVLIDRDDVREALPSLSRIGWRARAQAVDPRVAYLSDEVGESCAVRTRLAVDFVPRRYGGADSPYRRSRETWELEGAAIPVPGPTETLLAILVLHARADGSANVQWILDAKMVLASGIDWESLIEVGAENQQTHRLRAALGYLAELPGPRPPAWVLQRLARARTPARQRVAYLCTSGTIGGLGQLPLVVAEHLASTADQSALRVASSFPGRLRRRWGVSGRELPGAAARRALGLLMRRRNDGR